MLVTNGEKTKTEKDRNGDRKPDLFVYYEGGKIARQEEDSDFEGKIDLRSVKMWA